MSTFIGVINVDKERGDITLYMNIEICLRKDHFYCTLLKVIVIKVVAVRIIITSLKKIYCHRNSADMFLKNEYYPGLHLYNFSKAGRVGLI